jgi:hypothetical protein
MALAYRIDAISHGLKTLDFDASTKHPLPILILPFKTSLNDFIPDNHEFQVQTTLV